MRKLVLIGAEPFALVRDTLAAEADRRGVRLLEVEARAWGTTTTPWLELRGGRFRAGLLSPTGVEELGPEDVLWVLVEGHLPTGGGDYLRTEHEALRDGFHTCCPARTVNRRGLLAPLWNTVSWALLARQLAPVPGWAPVLVAPRLHLGTRPGDTRRWTRWPEAAGVGHARVWWTVPAPGPLHLALVAGGRATLFRLEEGDVRHQPHPPPALEEALTALATGCGADYLEVLLAPDTREGGPWSVLELSAMPEGLFQLGEDAQAPALAHLEHFARTLLAAREDGR